MKGVLSTSGVLAALALALLPQVCWCAPRAVVERPVYDAGEVPQGRDLEHEFLLENAGDEPLVFEIKPC